MSSFFSTHPYKSGAKRAALNIILIKQAQQSNPHNERPRAKIWGRVEVEALGAVGVHFLALSDEVLQQVEVVRTMSPTDTIAPHFPVTHISAILVVNVRASGIDPIPRGIEPSNPCNIKSPTLKPQQKTLGRRPATHPIESQYHLLER